MRIQTHGFDLVRVGPCCVFVLPAGRLGQIYAHVGLSRLRYKWPARIAARFYRHCVRDAFKQAGLLC